jgi:hypothetical protein
MVSRAETPTRMRVSLKPLQPDPAGPDAGTDKG